MEQEVKPYNGECCSWMMAGMYPDCKFCQEDLRRHREFEKRYPNFRIDISNAIADILKPPSFEGLDSGCP